MTAYYTSEKAKYGGTSGTIIPFSQTLPATNTPNFGDWKTLVPAGYLRCDGSIVLARLYPGLSQVIGVGSNCRFAKDPDTLSEDFFQLPDMGSKYIRASRSSGEYFDDVVYVEGRHSIEMNPSRYLGAWRSVNDVRVQLGPEKFDAFIRFIEERIAELDIIEVAYLTRAWSARRKG